MFGFFFIVLVVASRTVGLSPRSTSLSISTFIPDSHVPFISASFFLPMSIPRRVIGDSDGSFGGCNCIIFYHGILVFPLK